MKSKTSITLLIAVALGLVTAKVGKDLIQRYTATKAKADVTRVVVAKADLDPGRLLEATDLSVQEFPQSATPKAAFTDPKQVIGRTVSSPVAAGQMMFEGLLAPEGSAGGLQALVPDGMRAVSVEVSESAGVAGLLVPGCRVDVIATLRRASGDQITRTIVSNVKVTAVNRKLVKDNKDDKGIPIRTVTIVCTPKHAEAIELASTAGRPRLVLRGTSDDNPTEATGITMSELLGELNPEQSHAAAATSAPPETSTLDALLAAVNALQPVTAAAAVPATQPVVESTPESSLIRRPVQIIRAGSESTIYYEIETSPDGESSIKIGGAGSQPAAHDTKDPFAPR